MRDYERATAVEVVRPFVIRVTFADGMCREHDLEPELYGDVFEPLRDPDYFARVSLDAEVGVPVWPNGADFSPEFLYESGTLVRPADKPRRQPVTTTED